MASQQVLNAIGAQGPTTSARKQCFGVFSALLPNPCFENGDRGLGQGSTTFLSAFSTTMHVRAGSERDILVPQCGHFGQSQAGLNGGKQKGMITASQPRRSI